jgi:glutathione S-transferase
MQRAKFKLYHDALLRSVRVKWLLHELLGDDFEVEYVNIYGAEQYSARYLTINPNHAVPVLKITLEDGQFMHMVESAAMIALLADAFPEKGLAPATVGLSPARIEYLQVLHSGASIDMMLWQIRIHQHILPECEKDIRTVSRYRKKFATEMEPQLRSRLERGPFICGDRFSAADCIIAHCVMWARAYELCLDEPFDRYLGGLAERPAFRSAFSDAHRFVREVPRDSPVVAMFTG